MSEKEVFKVYLTYSAGGPWEIRIADLIFRDGIPIAVLAWGGSPENEVPEVFQSLDPAHLKELQGDVADYVYEGGPVLDPRKSH